MHASLVTLVLSTFSVESTEVLNREIQSVEDTTSTVGVVGIQQTPSDTTVIAAKQETGIDETTSVGIVSNADIVVNGITDMVNEMIDTASSDDVSDTDTDICLGNCIDGVCTFTLKVDQYASELGYYHIEECDKEGEPVTLMPTLGVQKGFTYHFKQHDLTNYFHPVGFAYYPDGDHDDKIELEPGITPPGSVSDCASTMTCPAPMYFLNSDYFGEYNNNELLGPLSTNEDDFGLDGYEPSFYFVPQRWAENGEYNVYLKFDVEDFTQDFFYFCHIHEFMSARVKFVDATGRPLSKPNLPVIPYQYDKPPSPYDESCGTYDLHEYQLPNAQCAHEYVCNRPVEQPELHNFTGCINSMNCAMQHGMTVYANEEDPITVFNRMVRHFLYNFPNLYI